MIRWTNFITWLGYRVFLNYTSPILCNGVTKTRQSRPVLTGYIYTIIWLKSVCRKTDKKRRWRWIGHVNRMPPTSIPRIAMRWTPAGNRRRGRPNKRDVEKVRGARDEGSRVELGPGRKAGSGQTTMAFLGVGLMCEHARRGLSLSLSVDVRRLQVAILARSPREMSQTDRIVWQYILSRVRISVRPSIFFIREKHP